MNSNYNGYSKSRIHKIRVLKLLSIHKNVDALSFFQGCNSYVPPSEYWLRSHILHRLVYHCLGPCVSLAYFSDVCILVSRTCVN